MTTAPPLPATEDASPSTSEGQSIAHVAPAELRRLQKNLLQAVTSCCDKKDILSAIGGLVREFTNPLVIRYYRRERDDQLAPTYQLLHGEGRHVCEAFGDRLLGYCKSACLKGQLTLDTLESSSRLLAVVVPVFLRNQAPEGFVFVFPETTRLMERTLVKLQLVASHVTLWHMLQVSNAAEDQAHKTAALVELLEKLCHGEDLKHGCYALVCELKDYLRCDYVAIGMRRGRRRDCCLQALSGCARFDKSSDRTRAIEAALDEAMLRGTLSHWPSSEESPSHATLAIAHLCSTTGVRLGASGPIRDEQGENVGAWLFLNDGDEHQSESAIAFLHAAEGPVGSCIRVLERAEQGKLRRSARRLLANRHSWRSRGLLAALCLLLSILAIPVPYKVKSECEIQPSTRRYVVAPYDGRLEKALVEPGDVISKGDVLAQMDGRDIRWELAGLAAEHGRAAKKRDVALAAHDVATEQLAKLEMEKLQLNMDMLNERAENLEIKSPIDGLVLSGEQQRSEGAPLTAGQSLFEIAPLDQIVVEIAVPEEEIRFVDDGLEAVIRLDAYPRRKWKGEIRAVHPRSETKDDRNVFVAEVPMDNPGDVLRPGMGGRVEVVTSPHLLAWNLFHKPVESVLTWLGW